MPRQSFHDRLFRLLLKLFPAEFRGDFGDNMAADFDDQRREVEGRNGAVRTLWVRTILDALRRAPREHLDVLSRDATYALRVLRRHPAASATAILSLAIGIGLNSAVYSVVGGVLWRSLPFTDSDRIVSIGSVTRSGNDAGIMTAKSFLDLQRRSQAFDRIAAAAFRPTVVIEPGEPAQVTCMGVSPGFFELLGARPILGRTFTQEDYDGAAAYRAITDKTSLGPSSPTVVLSHELWRGRFGGNANIVGTDMRVSDGQRVRIIGVVGRELETAGPGIRSDCWYAQTPQESHGSWMSYTVLAHLAPGKSLDEANTELAVIASNLGTDFFTKESLTLRAARLVDRMVARVRTQLIFLYGAVVCVLLVTCANVVNLFIAHAAGRRDELATRVALGASRGRLVRQLLTESLVVSVIGGALGFLLVLRAVPLLLAMAPTNVPRLKDISVDWTTFGFTFAVSLVVGLSCGLLASLSTRPRPRTLFGAAQSATTPRAIRLRRAVTICEVALALMLAIAASLMVRTVAALNAIDLGFDPRSVVSADLQARGTDMATSQDIHNAIAERVRALPGVRAAGVGVGPLVGGMGIGGLRLPADTRVFDSVRVDAVSPGYFEALGARLLEGRFFEPRDAVRSGPAVILVNATAAREFWRGSPAVGKTVIINNDEHLPVIGVINDIRISSLDKEPGPAIYQLSNQTHNFLANSMMIRVDGDPQAIVPQIRAIIRSVDRDAPFRGVEPLQTRIDRAMAPRLFMLRIVGLFSIIGLILAVVGVYGVLAEFVVQRVPEMGIRIAFGATRSDVLTLVLGQGARLVSIGVVLGFGSAVLLRNAMSTMVYGVRTSDPLTYAAACAVLFAATIAACVVPARRASRLDPVVALRSE
jgi:putative ABC transport system permease protein